VLGDVGVGVVLLAFDDLILVFGFLLGVGSPFALMCAND